MIPSSIPVTVCRRKTGDAVQNALRLMNKLQTSDVRFLNESFF